MSEDCSPESAIGCCSNYFRSLQLHFKKKFLFNIELSTLYEYFRVQSNEVFQNYVFRLWIWQKEIVTILIISFI